MKADTLFAFISQRELLKWTEELTKQITGAKASDYDKALDAVYNQTHIGGGFHRLFDGSHDAMNAWEKVHDALLDELIEEARKTSGLTFELVPGTEGASFQLGA